MAQPINAQHVGGFHDYIGPMHHQPQVQTVQWHAPSGPSRDVTGGAGSISTSSTPAGAPSRIDWHGNVRYDHDRRTFFTTDGMSYDRLEPAMHRQQRIDAGVPFYLL